jgi:uncharacterized protein (DUF924 family)
MKLVSPSDVLTFWFDKTIHGTLDSIKARMRLWFGRASTEFEEIQANNVDLLESLVNNTCPIDIWDIENDPKAAMAKVIVLDQFSRSIFRGTARAFASDEICASLVRHIVTEKDWFLTKYSPIERLFLCVSIQHSEHMENQTLGVSLLPQVAHGASDDIVHYFANSKGFSTEHHDVIQRFNRFPHRNELLVCEKNNLCILMFHDIYIYILFILIFYNCL